MRLNEKELRRVATAGGVGEKFAERALGSLRIEWAAGSPDSDVDEGKSYELGLRLNNAEALSKIDRTALERIFSPLLREYQRACPVVSGWMGRGDYNPKKIPANVTLALVIHACRTAGRLRARGMRLISESLPFALKKDPE